MQAESGTMAADIHSALPLRALAAAGRAAGRAAQRDPLEIATEFTDRLVGMLGGAGVVLEVVAASGERFVVTRGTPNGLVDSVASMLIPSRVGRPDGRIDVMEDIDRAPELAGTLLHESLRRAGVRGWFSMVLTADGEQSFGTLVVFVSDGAGVDAAARCATQQLAERLLLELERSWLASSVRASRVRFDAILNGLPDAVAVLSPDGRIAALNAACADFAGLGREAVVGRSFAELFGVDALSHASSELSMRRGDGRRVAVELSAYPARDEHGTVVVMRDVTRSRAAEDRLRESDRLAMLGTIAAGLGHDINNVLLPIRAHLNAIGAGGRRLAAAQLELHLTQIRSSLSYLQQLADSLHSLALDPDGEGDGVGVTVPAEWWRKTRPILEKALHRRAQLDCFIDESVPEVGAPPHALTRALLNLLVNAAEAMPPGRPQSSCRVVVRIRAAEGAAVIEVADNGVGMTEEVRRRAFDVFFTTKTRGLGTGLGLPLVRRVVDRAGGEVEIESRPGLGTTVRLRIPGAPTDQANAGPRAVIRLDDGRCTAIIRGYLDMFGVDAESVSSTADADLLVMDSSDASVDDVRQWCATREPSLLVLVGEPPAAIAPLLTQLGVTVIRDGSDIRAIEQGLVRALGLQVASSPRKEQRDV